MTSFQQKILKKIDNAFGRFFIIALYFLWKKIFGQVEKLKQIAEIRKVLIIRPGGLGDAILLTPLVIFLKEKLKTQIDFLGEKRNLDGAKFCYGDIVSNFFAYDSFKFIFFFLKNIKKYDVVIDTEQSFLLPAFFGRLLGKVLIGFDTTEKRKLFDIKAEYLFAQHEIKNFMRLGEKILLYFKRENERDLDELINSEEIIRKSQSFIRNKVKAHKTDNLHIVFSPFTTRWEKLYDEFGEVIEIMKKRGYRVQVIGDKKLTFDEVAQIILSAKIFVGVDNGLMHLAYMMGKKVIAIFGPSNHIKWGPLMGKVIRKNLWCSPCSNFAEIPPCPRNKECMRIEKEKIIEVIERMLKQETEI